MRLIAQNIDTTSIISYSDKLAFSLNFSTDLEEFYITEPNSDILAHLVSNNAVKLSIDVNYKILSFSYSFVPSFLPGNNDDNSKGSSSLDDYQLNLFPGRFVQSLQYRRLKGFYLQNTRDFGNLTTDKYFLFPDLKSVLWGGSTGYVLNPEFSIRSIFNQQEWQTINVGSFVPQLSYDFTKMTLETDTESSKENQVDIDLNMAYFYNWSVSSVFVVSPYAYVGGGPRFIHFRNGDISEKETYFVGRYGGGLQASYNISRLYAGASLSFKGVSYKTETNNVVNNNWFGAVYIGYRFEAPEFLQKLGKKL